MASIEVGDDQTLIMRKLITEKLAVRDETAQR